MVHSLTNDTYQAGAQSKDESNWEASQPGTIDNYVLKNENAQFASSDHMLAQDMDVVVTRVSTWLICPGNPVKTNCARSSAKIK